MATCMVDVEPQSFFGVACNLHLHPGKGCPIHGLSTEPAVLKRDSPEPETVEALLTEGLMIQEAAETAVAQE